jgi:hypothetical protein
MEENPWNLSQYQEDDQEINLVQVVSLDLVCVFEFVGGILKVNIFSIFVIS